MGSLWMFMISIYKKNNFEVKTFLWYNWDKSQIILDLRALSSTFSLSYSYFLPQHEFRLDSTFDWTFHSKTYFHAKY